MTSEKHQEIPEDMYKEHILELYRSPKNLGELKGKTHEKTEYNSSCGDEITVQMNVKNGIVTDAKFGGSGCVISIVASSLLTDEIKGKKISDIKKMKAEEMLSLLKVKLNPARVRCALLAFEAVNGALR